MRNRSLEIFLGLLIILVTCIFVIYTILTTTFSSKQHFEVNAIFHNIGSLTEDSKVTINGYEVGKISNIELEYPDYTIKVTIEINSSVKVPSDSQFVIQAAGLFDPPVIDIVPGKSDKNIQNNDVIYNTKDWESLEDKISGILFNVTNK